MRSQFLRQGLLLVAVFALALCAPGSVHAAGTAFSVLLTGILQAVRPMWIPVALLIIVIAGFTLAVSTGEGGLEKAKNTILAVVIGGILVVLGPTLVLIIYQLPGVVVQNNGAAVALEALGLANWIAAMGGMVGILFIVITALRAIFSFGDDEDAYSKVRRALMHVIFGLGIIAASALINAAVTTGSPNPLILLILDKISIILAFITSIALVVLIYAGLRMVLSYTNEESFAQAKSLIIRVLIGLGVILVSYVMVIVVKAVF